MADEFDDLVDGDPMSRKCARRACKRLFSPILDYMIVADSNRTIYHGGGPVSVLSERGRKLFLRFTAIGHDGVAKLSMPPSTQFLDGVWYWGDINNELFCSAYCARMGL